MSHLEPLEVAKKGLRPKAEFVMKARQDKKKRPTILCGSTWTQFVVNRYDEASPHIHLPHTLSDTHTSSIFAQWYIHRPDRGTRLHKWIFNALTNGEGLVCVSTHSFSARSGTRGNKIIKVLFPKLMKNTPFTRAEQTSGTGLLDSPLFGIASWFHGWARRDKRLRGVVGSWTVICGANRRWRTPEHLSSPWGQEDERNDDGLGGNLKVSSVKMILSLGEATPIRPWRSLKTEDKWIEQEGCAVFSCSDLKEIIQIWSMWSPDYFGIMYYFLVS